MSHQGNADKRWLLICAEFTAWFSCVATWRMLHCSVFCAPLLAAAHAERERANEVVRT